MKSFGLQSITFNRNILSFTQIQDKYDFSGSLEVCLKRSSKLKREATFLHKKNSAIVHSHACNFIIIETVSQFSKASKREFQPKSTISIKNSQSVMKQIKPGQILGL